MCATHREKTGGAPEWWRYIPVVLVILATLVVGTYVVRGSEKPQATQSARTVPTAPPAPTYGPTSQVDPTSSPTKTVSPSPARDTPKPRPFLPETMQVARIGTNPIERLPRIHLGPNIQFPSPTGYNPSVYAWDMESARPGSPKGVTILIAHSYSSSDAALGNRLTASVVRGDELSLQGSGNSRTYVVTERMELHGSQAYYEVARDWLDPGAPAMVALTVCSDYNPATDEWESRTVWLAEPVK